MSVGRFTNWFESLTRIASSPPVLRDHEEEREDGVSNSHEHIYSNLFGLLFCLSLGLLFSPLPSLSISLCSLPLRLFS